MIKAKDRKAFTLLGIVGKVKTVGYSFICFSMVFFLLGLYGCAPQIAGDFSDSLTKDKQPIETPTPLPFSTSQILLPITSIVTATPKLTPNAPPDPTPYTYVTLNDKQLKSVIQVADEWHNLINASDQNSIYTREYTEEIAKRLCGCFETLDIKKGSSEEEINHICSKYYFEIFSFLSTCSDNLLNTNLIKNHSLCQSTKSSALYKELDASCYLGVYTLHKLQSMSDDLYTKVHDKAPDSKDYSKECLAFLVETLVTNKYDFMNMYPMIQIQFCIDAERLLFFINEMTGYSLKEEVIDGYSIWDLIILYQDFDFAAQNTTISYINNYYLQKLESISTNGVDTPKLEQTPTPKN